MRRQSIERCSRISNVKLMLCIECLLQGEGERALFSYFLLIPCPLIWTGCWMPFMQVIQISLGLNLACGFSSECEERMHGPWMFLYSQALHGAK